MNLKIQKTIQQVLIITTGIALMLGCLGCWGNGYDPDKDPFYYGDNNNFQKSNGWEIQEVALESPVNSQSRAIKENL